MTGGMWERIYTFIATFKGKGKKSAWEAWQVFEGVTDTFCILNTLM